MGPVEEALERAGISPARVFRRAELPLSLIEHPDQLIPLRDQLVLVAAATHELGDPTFPFRLSHSVGIESLGAFGQRISFAPSLRASILACNESIQRMLQTMTRMSLSERGGVARWAYEVVDDVRVGRQENELLAFGYMASLLHRFTGSQPIRAELPSGPHDKVALEDVLGCEIQKGEKAALLFPAEWLMAEGPAFSGNGAVDPDRIPFLEDVGAIIEHVIRLGLLGSNSSIRWASRRMRMSTRTLQRRLSAGGTTFEQVRRRVFLRWAISLLERSSTPITEIAYELGYSDPAHFARAMTRWTGRSPSAWRRDASSCRQELKLGDD
jgi:AraC-like DNA-binding protein